MQLPNFPELDMFAAGINAMYGVLKASEPSYDRGYTVGGLLIMAYFGGIGGGVARDLLLNEIPSPLKGPNYIIACLLLGLLGLGVRWYAGSKEERFRKRMRQYFKSFSLPWLAILGTHKALDHDLGILAAIVIGVISTTAGGVLIELFSGVTPEIVVPSEQQVTAAVIASGSYAVIASLDTGLAFFPVTLLAVLAGFTFRVIAVREHWGAIVPSPVPPDNSSSRS